MLRDGVKMLMSVYVALLFNAVNWLGLLTLLHYFQSDVDDSREGVPVEVAAREDVRQVAIWHFVLELGAAAS